MRVIEDFNCLFFYSVITDTIIAISNESSNRFDKVEVSFADFAKDMNEDAVNTRLEPHDFKVKMKKQRMKMMKIK